MEQSTAAEVQRLCVNWTRSAGAKAAVRPDQPWRHPPAAYLRNGCFTRLVRFTPMASTVNPKPFAPPIAACLDLAEAKNVEYMSFPSISTGVYGYPVREAAAIALDEVTGILKQADRRLQRAVFVLFDNRTHAAYVEALRGIAD